jgi:DNA-binding SARP family transcriptional activator
VESSGGALVLAPGVRVDVREFTEWARWVLDPGTDVGGVTSVDRGLTGELLPGWYDEWVLVERERLCQLRMHALEAWAGKLAAAGRYGEAVQAACAAVGVEPLRESAHRVLVRVHLAEGNVAEAVRSYESFRALLAVELGVEPTAQMDTLVSRFRRSAAVPLITTR